MNKIIHYLNDWLDKNDIKTQGVKLTLEFPNAREQYAALYYLKRELEPFTIDAPPRDTFIKLHGIEVEIKSREELHKWQKSI